MTNKLLRKIVTVVLLMAAASCGKKEDQQSSEPSNTATPGGPNTVAVSGESAAPGASRGNGSAPTVESSPYNSQNVPGSLAIALPTSLVKDTPTSLRLLEGQTAEGYRQLVEHMDPIPDLIASLTERLYEIDAVIVSVENTCTESSGENWTDCQSSAAIQTAFSEEVYAGVLSQVHSDVMTSEQIDDFNARIGELVTLGTMRIEKKSVGDYDKCVTLTPDEIETTTYCFNATDVHVVQTRTTKSTGGSGVESVTTNTSTIIYEGKKQKFVLNLNATYDGDASDAIPFEKETVSTFTMKQDPETADARGLMFNTQFESRERGVKGQLVKQSGIADNNGGFVDSLDRVYSARVLGVKLSAPTEPDVVYGVFPPAQAVTTKDFEYDPMVFFHGNGFDGNDGEHESGGTDLSNYFGPYPPPTNYILWSWSESEGIPVVTNTGIVVQQINVPYDSSYYYEEEFDGSGIVDYWTIRWGEVDSEVTGGEGEAGGSYEQKFHQLTTRGTPLDL